MESRSVSRSWGDQAEPAQQLRAGNDADDKTVAAESFPLADRQHCGNDDGARMDWTTLEGVVEVLAMGGRAVDEGCAERVEAACMSQRHAGTSTIDGSHDRSNVVAAACRDAQTGDVEKQPARHCDGLGRQIFRLHGR